MEELLAAADIVKSYGTYQALKGVSLTLNAGQMAAVMGPSGCGKSSLLLILGLLQKPDHGTYTCKGRDLLGLDAGEQALFRRQFFGFILQSCAVFAYSTVEENVEFPLIYSGVPRKERLARVRELLDSVNLSGKAQARSNLLSGGEQQRVAIARALINNPKVLLADEPTGQLDAENTRKLMAHFRSVCENLDVGIIVVTHDPQVADYCDTVYSLQDGRAIVACKHFSSKPASGHAANNRRP
ncbi:MAG: ABC transporter ATP-binding protein [Desulfovibrio sp.]|jgi:ABC-type lipoprotein export system ATPase subunit|nr:ABC transporter ATP-binding protein [Desulfovibrio sp.]